MDPLWTPAHAGASVSSCSLVKRKELPGRTCGVWNCCALSFLSHQGLPFPALGAKGWGGIFGRSCDTGSCTTHTHTHTHAQNNVEPGPGTHMQKRRHCAKDRGHRLGDWSWVQVTLGGRKKRKRRCMVTGVGFTQIKNQNSSEAPKSCQKEAS